MAYAATDAPLAHVSPAHCNACIITLIWCEGEDHACSVTAWLAPFDCLIIAVSAFSALLQSGGALLNQNSNLDPVCIAKSSCCDYTSIPTAAGCHTIFICNFRPCSPPQYFLSSTLSSSMM